ncbi:formate dehydrogenase subunit gamma [bacterium]|jgi:formate dehydrogenase subunit gamma|nr:formate dehydrogenase subunit gamma [bacterium]
MTDHEGADARFEKWDPGVARYLAASMADMAGPCLPILHALQARFGYIHREAIPIVADVLNLSRAEVVGIVSFYHDFRDTPPGDHVLRLCRAESCQAMGAEALVAELTDRLGAAPGSTASDGSVTIDSVYCLGNCALSPAAMLDGRLLGRVTPERVMALLEGVGA